MRPDSVMSLFSGHLDPEPDDVHEERLKVRMFVREAVETGLMTPQCDSWLSAHSAEFSRELGRRGWIGMTWPREYGGRESSQATRLAVIEELLAAGAPVAAHWFADRQIGPSLLRHGTEAQRAFFLPAMARGELFFCIGMSEADSGSDLASVRTRATRAGDGWEVNGSKIWTSHAQHAHYMLALVRTGSPEAKSSEALTQIIIDMRSPGVTVRPIPMLGGREHFCEVFLDHVVVPEDRILGPVGAGWRQVLGELGFERSGPERFLSTFPLMNELTTASTEPPESHTTFGSLVARLLVLRAMAGRVNAHLDASEAPGVAAAIVKDLGTTLENESIDAALDWLESRHLSGSAQRLFDQAQSHAPGFTLRGGTTEIMRDIIARAMAES
jgi:acyl-CoA dehydrogenase